MPATTPLPVPLAGDDPRSIAGYRLHARVGRGGMGAVYLSFSRGGQPVAVKLIRPEYVRDTAFRARFAREAALAHQVAGRHLVPVVDHDTDGERPWLATRYVPGVPLGTALRTHGPLPPFTVLQVLAGAATALHAVHTTGVVHRDVKPGNILLAGSAGPEDPRSPGGGHSGSRGAARRGTGDGPWLLDFGLARAVGATAYTTAGRMIGTPRYMSPEHARGGEVTSASDVFALGLIGAEAATGTHPYDRGGHAGALAVAARIAGTDREPPDLSALPEPLRTLVGACLQDQPGHRPTADALAAQCAAAAGASGRDVTDFGGWLPAPLAARIREVEQTVSRLTAFAQAPTIRSVPQTAPLTVPDGPDGGSEWQRRVRRDRPPTP